MTVREILNEGTALLGRSIDTASLDASLLLAEVLRTDRAGLIIKSSDTVDKTDAENYRKLLDRRLSGECVAYILGRKEFRALEFTVNTDVLVPRPDTETLVEAALEWLECIGIEAGSGAARPLRLLDLCTGSGAVAVALKNERPALEVWASDMSESALATARANATKLLAIGVAAPIRFVLSDLFNAFLPGAGGQEDFSGFFDLIVSNPPYIASAEIETLPPEVRGEPLLALDGGEDGLAVIRKIAARAGAFLAPGGRLLIEADPRQMAALEALLANSGWFGLKRWQDLAGRDRVIGGTFIMC